MKKAIIIMTKVPAAGEVKTRMQPFLTKEQSADLAEALLKDTEIKVTKVECDSLIAFSPADKKKRLNAILQHDHTLIEQLGTNLGERMANAFEFGFGQGLDAILMIGIDSPTFPLEFFKEAFQYLESGNDIVLGESEDGGFYLIGLNSFKPELFENVDWGSSSAFQQTKENSCRLGLILNTLPKWYDIDYPSDLDQLRTELSQNPHIAANTFEWLMKI